jgi:CopG family transcriptional regulator / antitoxin EndoAI
MCIFGVYHQNMKKAAHKRINITLPEATVAMLEEVADKGSRSTFIDDAIKTQVKSLKQQNLRDQLKEGAIARAERNLQMAKEWSHLEDEVWQKYL